MPDQFRTVRREGIFELIRRGSRFIGICRPVTTEQDAQKLLEDSRLSYPEARHYVYAWRTDTPYLLQRFSDDGEPHGTGGRQVLEVLVREEVDRAALVVVRYFGGILLGTGGLSRAYAEAARGALAKAVPVHFERCQVFLMETDYAIFHQLGDRLETAGFFVEAPDFGVTVCQIVGATSDRADALRELVANLSAGKATLTPAGERWIETTR
ncbi:MAG TPA: YigZ family protein [Clostridia bacterium]|nr:YigZ family protein [Clostridia bacterium]